MSKEINHWCVVCGKGYHACDTCNETKSFTPWRTLTDSIEHFKIFTVLKDYNNKLIDKKKAKELLSNLNLSDKDSFKDSSKKLLYEIFNEEAIERKVVKRKKDIEKNENFPEMENENLIEADNSTQE